MLTKELCEELGEYNKEGFALEDINNVENLSGIQEKSFMLKI